MKWYYLIFNQIEIYHGVDQELFKQCLKLIHSEKSPLGLVLYELKFTPEDGKKIYYISSPPEYVKEVKKIASFFTASEVSRPNLKVLIPVIGKPIELLIN